MLVVELIKRKNGIKQKLDELEFYLEKISNIPNKKESGPVYTDVLNRIFGLLDKYQNYIVLLERSNISTKIQVGNTEVSVSDAIKIRTTMDEKIKVFTNTINNNDAFLDVPDLIDKRDKLIEEHMLLNNVIEKSDWSIEID